MSNNNPHGHISQPAQNPSWNPLQLDHQINPLLTPYVRGPSPFDSMDLSLQSSRSASSPLTKSGLHTLMPQQTQQHLPHSLIQPTQQQHQQQQSQMHTANSYPIHNLSTNSSNSSSLIHSQQQSHTSQLSTSLAQQQQQHGGGVSNIPPPMSSASSMTTTAAAGAKFTNSNGNDCEPVPASNCSGSDGVRSGSIGNIGVPSPATLHYMREADTRLNEAYPKMSHLNRNFENQLSPKSLQKPVELVNKDCGYTPTLASNKMQSNQQQISSKKHSPLRNYQTHHTQHQQQQQLPYNNSQNIKHNGPHTPPTAHSPILHQPPTSTATAQNQMAILPPPPVMHTNSSSALDYNQLHLQHPQQQSSFLTASQPQQQHQQQQQQHHQQHQSPQLHLQQQQNLHYSPHATTHQANQTQMQHQQHTAHHQLTQLSQQQLHQHHSLLPSYHTHSQLAHLDAFVNQTTPKASDVQTDKPIITDLSVAPSVASFKPPLKDTSCLIPDRPESPEVITSNEESLDSNSNSSSCRKRRKRKANKIVRVPSNESMEIDEYNTNSMALLPQNETQQTPVVRNNNNGSECAKISPNKELKSQINSNNKSPIPLLTETLNAEKPAKQPEQLNHSENSKHDLQVDKKLPTLENGRQILPTIAMENEVKSELKTTEIVEKVEVVSDENSNGSIKSPKDLKTTTKKECQALEMRNNEHNSNSNSNSIGSTNSFNETNDDNAVLGDELNKEPSVTDVEKSAQHSTGIVRPLSPQSISSSSSSSSSSCSNSSHSSNGCKSQKSKNTTECDEGDKKPTETKTQLERAVVVDNCKTPKPVDSEDIEKPASIAAFSDEKVADDVSPLNLNRRKSSGDISSPGKTRFEEVENKLEEMFAGIEDEPIVPISDENPTTVPLPNESEVANDLSLALQLSAPTTTAETKTNVTSNGTVDEKINENIADANNVVDDTHKTESSAPAPTPTKAAKKATESCFVKPATPPPIEEKTVQTPKRSTPRRRLSVNLDPENLRISLHNEMNENTKIENKAKNAEENNNNTNPKQLAVCLDDEQPSTSKAAAAALAARNAAQAKAAAAAAKNSQSTATAKKENSRKKNTKTASKSKGGNSNAQSVAGVSAATTSKGNSNKNNSKLKKPLSTSKGQNDDAASTLEPKTKGPCVIIRPDGSLNIINAASAEDVIEKLKQTTKITSYPQERTNRRGLHSSTLSNKYDATTTDSTWVCVFCKQGPHKNGLGDLYGPYLISTDNDEYRGAMGEADVIEINSAFTSKRRRLDMLQTKARNLPVVPATLRPEPAEALNTGRVVANKKKRKLANDIQMTTAVDIKPDVAEQNPDKFLGMAKKSDNSYEVWMHEDCAVWAPNVLLVGARITGLDFAVWNSCVYQCVFCTKPGAIICCLQRECKAAAHVPCARDNSWQLDETTLNVHCQTHSWTVKKFTPPQIMHNIGNETVTPKTVS